MHRSSCIIIHNNNLTSIKHAFRSCNLLRKIQKDASTQAQHFHHSEPATPKSHKKMHLLRKVLGNAGTKLKRLLFDIILLRSAYDATLHTLPISSNQSLYMHIKIPAS